MLTITQRLALAFCLAFTPMLWAQTVTGTISGTVIDPGGRTVPGAKINVVNEANGASRTATTVENGDFTVPSLEPGTTTCLTMVGIFYIPASRRGSAPFRMADLPDIG